MILSTTLIAAVSATHAGRQTAEAALDVRKANDLIAYLLETAPSTPGSSAGEADGFAWLRVVSQPVESFGRGAICERQVVLTGLRDQRRYDARTNAVCPAALES